MPQPLLLVVAAIITQGDKVLLIKRAREPFKGFWSFVGGIGGFEQTGDPEEVVKLEVQGDLGCAFRGTFWGYRYEHFPEYQLSSVVLYFHGSISGDIQINPTYVSECRWIPLPEAVNFKLGFGHHQILKDFLSGRKIFGTRIGGTGNTTAASLPQR